MTREERITQHLHAHPHNNRWHVGQGKGNVTATHVSPGRVSYLVNHLRRSAAARPREDTCLLGSCTPRCVCAVIVDVLFLRVPRGARCELRDFFCYAFRYAFIDGMMRRCVFAALGGVCGRVYLDDILEIGRFRVESRAKEIIKFKSV